MSEDVNQLYNKIYKEGIIDIDHQHEKLIVTTKISTYKITPYSDNVTINNHGYEMDLPDIFTFLRRFGYKCKLRMTVGYCSMKVEDSLTLNHLVFESIYDVIPDLVFDGVYYAVYQHKEGLLKVKDTEQTLYLGDIEITVTKRPIYQAPVPFIHVKEGKGMSEFLPDFKDVLMINNSSALVDNSYYTSIYGRHLFIWSSVDPPTNVLKIKFKTKEELNNLWKKRLSLNYRKY